jgi:hypothetical protein
MPPAISKQGYKKIHVLPHERYENNYKFVRILSRDKFSLLIVGNFLFTRGGGGSPKRENYTNF